MKTYLTLFCAFLLCCCIPFLNAANAGYGSIAWKTDYREALNESKSTGKPVILFFTGSDWCGWCTKLEKEVLNTQEFANLAGSKFIFVMLDFPLYKPQDANLAAANKQIQEQFNVQGFPTLIMTNSDQRQLGITGYRPGGPKLFAEHLLQMANNASG